MAAYYNEFDSFAADWLENLIKEGLIPDGHVDRRSIEDVAAEDIDGFEQVHFFAGIGGWALALRLAGWPDSRPVWTGSCPCQPFSAAGKQRAQEDERHLWPEMFRFIKSRRPEVIFGEQVASSEVVGTQLEASFVVAVQAGDFGRANKLAKQLVATSSFHFHQRWLSGIRSDLATEDYALWFPVLGAHSAGAPHLRQRLFWLANARSSKCGRGSQSSRQHGRALHIADRCGADGMADAAGNSRAQQFDEQGIKSRRGSPEIDATECGGFGGLADSYSERLSRRAESDGEAGELAKQSSRRTDAGGCGGSRGMGNSSIDGIGSFERERIEGGRSEVSTGGPGTRSNDGLGQSFQSRLEGHAGDVSDGNQSGRFAAIENGSIAAAGAWSDFRIVECTDGKSRRVGGGVQPLAHGIPRDMGRGQPELSKLVKGARGNRVGRLKGYGNAIVPYAAAKIIRACMYVLNGTD